MKKHKTTCTRKVLRPQQCVLHDHELNHTLVTNPSPSGYTMTIIKIISPHQFWLSQLLINLLLYYSVCTSPKPTVSRLDTAPILDWLIKCYHSKKTTPLRKKKTQCTEVTAMKHSLKISSIASSHERFCPRGVWSWAFQAALFHPESNPEKVPHDVTSGEPNAA